MIKRDKFFKLDFSDYATWHLQFISEAKKVSSKYGETWKASQSGNQTWTTNFQGTKAKFGTKQRYQSRKDPFDNIQ